MLLNNVRPVNERNPVNILLGNEKILSAGKTNKPAARDPVVIDFTDAIVFPGLINSHDHLDFNCFSPLGDTIYNNYTEWGFHIHTAYKEYIKAVLKIPQPLRTAWGMYKNLLAGITTVINHGPALSIQNPLINVYQEPQSLHSVKFQKNWKYKLNNPLLQNKACVIHTGEGTDKQSTDEIDELLKWNLLKRKLIGVHGVAMNATQAKKFAGLIWCPESNRVLLNSHADVRALKAATRLVFGTDSTLTGRWNVWQHLRLARKLKAVSDADLFSMVTAAPAALWGFNNGALLPGKDADIVVANTRNSSATWNDFFAINPKNILLVLQKGKIRMFDETLFSQLNNQHAVEGKFSQASINGHVKFIAGDLPALISTVQSFHPGVMLPLDSFEANERCRQ